MYAAATVRYGRATRLGFMDATSPGYGAGPGPGQPRPAGSQGPVRMARRATRPADGTAGPRERTARRDRLGHRDVPGGGPVPLRRWLSAGSSPHAIRCYGLSDAEISGAEYPGDGYQGAGISAHGSANPAARSPPRPPRTPLCMNNGSRLVPSTGPASQPAPRCAAPRASAPASARRSDRWPALPVPYNGGG